MYLQRYGQTTENRYIFYNIHLITIAREEFLTFNCYKNNLNEFLSWRFKIFKQGLNFR